MCRKPVNLLFLFVRFRNHLSFFSFLPLQIVSITFLFAWKLDNLKVFNSIHFVIIKVQVLQSCLSFLICKYRWHFKITGVDSLSLPCSWYTLFLMGLVQTSAETRLWSSSLLIVSRISFSRWACPRFPIGGAKPTLANVFIYYWYTIFITLDACVMILWPLSFGLMLVPSLYKADYYYNV